MSNEPTGSRGHESSSGEVVAVAAIRESERLKNPDASAQCQVRTPKGNPPAAGWPVLVFLHGCGENQNAYVHLAEAAANNGFTGVAISGPITMRGGRCAWPEQSLATHGYLREVLARSEEEIEMGRARLFLCGFSQGGTHAFDLLVSRPDDYWGAIVLSPGDGPVPSAVAQAVKHPRPLVVAYGQKEYRIFRKRAQKFAKMWQRENWPCLLESHPGGHHFPADWESRLPRHLRWLDAQTRDW
jgi:predicted esterase